APASWCGCSISRWRRTARTTWCGRRTSCRRTRRCCATGYSLKETLRFELLDLVHPVAPIGAALRARDAEGTGALRGERLRACARVFPHGKTGLAGGAVKAVIGAS